MTKLVTISAGVDPDLKEQVEEILRELGLSATQALTLFYQQIRLNRGIPFALQLPEDQTEQMAEADATPSATLFPMDSNRAIMEKNVEAYKAMHPNLLGSYLGQYVAVCDRELVDHDSDPVELLTRVRQNYPGQVVLRRKVKQTPKRELRIRHPRFERVA